MNDVAPLPAPEGGLSTEALSRRYRAVLIRYFARRGISDGDAQDLAQEAFVRLARHEGSGAVERADAYLFTTAANLITEFARYHAVRAANPPEGFRDSLHRGAEFAPDRLLEGREQLDLLVTLLSEMPERMRNVVVLARLENLPRSEIAVQLGVSKRTVEQDLTTGAAYIAARWRAFE